MKSKVVLFLFVAVVVLCPFLVWATPIIIDFNDLSPGTDIAGQIFSDLRISPLGSLTVFPWGGSNNVVFSDLFPPQIELSSKLPLIGIGFDVFVPSMPGADNPVEPEFTTIGAFDGTVSVPWTLTTANLGSMWWNVKLMSQSHFTSASFEWSGFGVIDNLSYEVAAVPEPGTCLLFISGLAGLGILQFRKLGWQVLSLRC